MEDEHEESEITNQPGVRACVRACKSSMNGQSFYRYSAPCSVRIRELEGGVGGLSPQLMNASEVSREDKRRV